MKYTIDFSKRNDEYDEELSLVNIKLVEKLYEQIQFGDIMGIDEEGFYFDPNTINFKEKGIIEFLDDNFHDPDQIKSIIKEILKGLGLGYK